MCQLNSDQTKQMNKTIVILILTLFLFSSSNAQQSGDLIYYLKNNGKLVSNKDSADYSMVVFPPDTSVDKNLYIVREYYKDGKLRLTTNSKTNDINLQYHGRYMAYFPNGRKMKAGEFEYGVPVGHQISYYPNGKFYNSLNYFPGGKILYNDLRDSTGKVLAENGTGSWVDYGASFKDTVASGKIDSGYRVGTWVIKTNNNEHTHEEYEKGILKSSRYFYKSNDSVFLKVDVVPQFPGGMQGFFAYLGKNLRYPVYARTHGIQGKVIISFVVEVNGKLSDMKVVRGVDGGISEEAMRVMLLSPPWSPGMAGGKPVRVKYSVPISFALSE